jgi:hypothetical protein
MRYAVGPVAALFLLALPWAAAGPPAPHSVSATYGVYRNGGQIAVMNESFEANEGSYRIVSESRAVGLLALFERHPLRVTSSGRLTTGGLRPQQFEGGRGEADPRRVRADFDWQEGRLTILHDGRTDSLALPPDTQDRLSLMYQFMFLAPDRHERMEFSMTNGRKLDQYRYAIHAGVEIETPLGRMTTVHLVKERQPHETATEIWLAPQHRFLPVRMVVEEHGSRYEQVITRLELKP